ncbi:MAG TPA: tryptophan-rich sensory protein [Thermoanaerobaculia bacterium]|nr:tryptophan-rich sensory protein [Thermoanaerobaculia bacterium]
MLPLALSILICAGFAALEGLCAGTNVKRFFAELRFPRYSAPLWVWSIIGAIYYVIFGFILFRLLTHGVAGAVEVSALLLTASMMLLNALTNFVIFRARNLRLAFIVGGIFPVLDVGLFLCLVRLDRVAAWSLVPYLMYRVYAVWWGYSLWRINQTP